MRIALTSSGWKPLKIKQKFANQRLLGFADDKRREVWEMAANWSVIGVAGNKSNWFVKKKKHYKCEQLVLLLCEETKGMPKSVVST